MPSYDQESTLILMIASAHDSTVPWRAASAASISHEN